MNEKTSVSFSFNKRSSKKSLVRIDDSLNEQKDFVTSVEDKQIQSQNSKPVEKKDYYVPLIKKINWRVPSHQQGAQSNKHINKSEEELELDKEAAAAIMKDLQEARDNITNDDDNLNVVPLLMQNKAPVNDDCTKADVELRPSQSTLHDYNDMPVSQFGIACLRGMGWKKSEGIGLTNKRCVEPIEFIQRSTGQGLGATLKPGEPKKRKLKPGEEAREVSQPIREKSGRVRWRKTLDEEIPKVIEGYSIGAYVTVISGPHNGLLGKIVEGDDNAGMQSENVNVRLSLNKQVVQCDVKQLQLLSVDEFQQLKEQSRKKSRMQKYGLIKMQSKDIEDDNVICVEDSIAPVLPLHPLIRDDGPATAESTVAAKGHKHKKKRCRDPMEDSYYLHKLPPPVTVSWLSPNLRVRIISKDYCKGQYYNHKVNIIDVTSFDSCMCRTDDGKLLDDLHQSNLETLIPKEKYANVMVVTGEHKHKLAIVLERNSSKSIVTVQMEDSKEVVTLSYNDVCQCITTMSHVE